MKKKMEIYLPLKIVKMFEERGEYDIVSALKADGTIPEDLSAEEFVDVLMAGDVLLPGYRGKFQQFSDLATSQAAMEAARKNLPGHAQDDDEMIRLWIRTFYVTRATAWLWAQHKQSYYLDHDFFEELRMTENISVPSDAFLRLPVPTIYIDFSECDTEDISGAFVRIYNSEAGCQFAAFLVSDDFQVIPTKTFFDYGDDGVQTLDAQHPVIDALSDSKISDQLFANILSSIIQVLLFLTSRKPDVMESPRTKKTYRRPQKIKNKFSEVQQWDVGVRYGAAIRIARDQAEKEAAGEVEADIVPGKSGKPKRPHVRRAHWHRYRIGHGRKEVEVKWIPPVFVNGGKEIPVVIHEIE